MSNKTEIFLDLYRQLEYVGRVTYFSDREDADSINIVGKLMNIPYLAEYKEEINFCRVVRNFLTHNPKVGNGDFAVTPSDSMIKMLREVLERVSNPELALKYSIPKDKIVIAHLSDPLMPTLEKMHKMGYTNVPIYEHKNLVGILNEKIIYTYICAVRSVTIDQRTKISAFKEYLSLNNSENRHFAFVPHNTPIHDVSQLFEDNYKKNKLLSVVFITENGKPSETILGMITPWDLIK